MTEVDELRLQLEILDDQRAAGELGWDDAAEQMNRLRAEHPEAAALLSQEAKLRYLRTGRRTMALDPAATPKDRAINDYQQVVLAERGLRSARQTLPSLDWAKRNRRQCHPESRMSGNLTDRQALVAIRVGS